MPRYTYTLIIIVLTGVNLLSNTQAELIRIKHIPEFNSADNNRHMRETINMMKIPNTIDDLMQNIKSALTQELFLDQLFFTEESLKTLTGGAVVNIHSTPFGVTAEVRDENALFDGFKQAKRQPFVILRLSANSYFSLSLYVPHQFNSQFTYDLIEKHFGQSANFIDPPLPKSNTIKAEENWNKEEGQFTWEISHVDFVSGEAERGPVTHVHGGKNFIIRMPHNAVVTEISGKLKGNGELFDFKITQQRSN